MRYPSWIAPALVVLLAPTAAGQKPPVESAVRARDIVERAIQAHGGFDALSRISTISRELFGRRTDVGQGMRPGTPGTNRPRVWSIIDFRGGRTYERVVDTIEGGQPLDIARAYTSSGGWVAALAKRTVRSVNAANAATSRTVAYRRYPEGILLGAGRRHENLRHEGEDIHEGRRQDIVSYADVDGTQLSLWFDRGTGLLTKSGVVRVDATRGDGTAEVVYRDYQLMGNVQLPTRLEDWVAGTRLQDMRIETRLNAEVSDSQFAEPKGLAPMTSPPSGLKAVSERVWVQSSGYATVVVEFTDHLAVVEAGSSIGAGQALLAQLDAQFPGKPVRYVIATHFHEDHISGIRPFVSRGATIVTTAHAAERIRAAVAVQHRLRPDAFSRAPREPVIEVVTGRRVLAEPGVTLEIHDIGPTTHVDQMLVAYVPSARLLYEADLLDLDQGAVTPGGTDTQQLSAAISRLGLEVERIVATHGGLGTRADLDSALRLGGQRSNRSLEGITKSTTSNSDRSRPMPATAPEGR